MIHLEITSPTFKHVSSHHVPSAYLGPRSVSVILLLLTTMMGGGPYHRHSMYMKTEAHQ